MNSRHSHDHASTTGEPGDPGPRRRRRALRWILPISAAVAGAGLLAACGTSTSSSGQSNAGAATPKAHSIVAVRTVPGAGKVLVDSTGHTLYTAKQDSAAMIHCTGSCVAVWIPLTTSSSTITLPNGVTGHLTTVKRPDTGKMQLAYGGKPLYTFKLDGAAGQAKGNGAHDNFNGTAFSWQAAVVGGGAAAPAPSPSSTGGNGTY